MANINESIETVLVLHVHQPLIDNLFEFLYGKLVNHIYNQNINHYPY